MDLLIKKRSPVRANFSKTYNALTNLLKEESPKEENIKTTFASLKRIHNRLVDLDDEISNNLLENSDMGEYEAECNAIEEYNEKMDKASVSVEIYLEKEIKMQYANSVTSSPVTKKKLKLPKIELVKFSSEIKDWLSFWSQFKRIHEDNDIENEDKFQYLIQCISEGTRAREIIDSFPPTSDNYEKAIESLKSRFGRDELLIEFYVRQLLKLVVQNATEAKNRVKTSNLYDKLESYLRALESIGLTSDKYSAMLFPLVESCIPEEIFRVWLRNPGNITNGSSNNVYGEKLKNLLSFLKTEVEGDERIRLAQSSFVNEYRQRKEKSQHFVQPTANDLFSGTMEKKRVNNPCVFCDKFHDSKECFNARKLNLEQKQEILRNKKCCFLCFKIGHRSKFCKTNMKCVLCNKRHLVLMCPELPVNKSTEKHPDSAVSKVSLSSHCVPEEVLLQTLIVKLKSKGKERQARVLIDSGSQQSYILESTAANLGLDPIEKKSFIHSLFGGFNTEEKNHNIFKVKLEALSGNFSCDIEVLDQPTICSKIPRLKKGSWNKELQEKKIWIADYGKGCPDIELLIGADICGKLFTGNMHKLKCGLIACETHLGWLIMGKVPGEKFDCSLTNVITSLFIKNASVANLWEIDILGIKDPVETKSREELEAAALEHFRKTFSVGTNGRYEVHLPWKETNHDLNDNKEIAEKRCISTSLKLKREEKFDGYDAVFKDWEESGIIEVVPEEELQNPSHYLPHRAVFKENSTTKIRPVFDASCHEKGHPSLNDCLEKGPNLLEEIPPILMRFRKDKIGVVADIKKAFLQISVAKEDCDFLRFLWWEDFEKRKMKVFRHRRVVFGLSCSPFLLAAVLHHHIQESPIEMQETADILKRSFYVDNCITSLPNEEKLQMFIQQSRSLLERACFDLRGWENSSFCEIKCTEKPISVLGLLWDKNDDNLFCDLTSVKDLKNSVTKRSVLSTVHSIFDPLGFLCPVTVIPKLIVQQTWNLKIGWDTELPEELRNKFEDWKKDLELLSSVKIPRCLDICKHNTKISLHVFADASKLAYSTVVFLRRVDREVTTVHLIQAKSRIAPLHKMTIPRLELLACCIGARLAHSVIKALDLQDIPTAYWTDSSTALSWIKRNEHWGVFVNNRVKEIRTLSNAESWRHIPGDYNPADLPSRGCSIKAYLKSKWWEGPSWLRQDEKDWPRSEVQIDEEEVSKEKRKGLSLVSTLLFTEAEEKWYSRKFSKYSQILRMVAWILRFANNSLKPNKKITGELLISELEIAEKKLIKIIQQDHFRESESQTQLKSLCTFLDDEGLLRLKTKITRRIDEENFLCPMILPSKNDVVDKLIHERHLQMSHAGAQAVLTNIRQQFWILRGRKTVQRVITKCVRCRRHAAKGVESIPTPLPEDRIRDALVFEVTGLDLAGPLYLKNGDKSWILLFTCAVYRAVHLELLQSVSTNCFLLGLRRFIARRGRPKIIYSDNGSNFIGAENLMKSLNWEQITRDTSVYRIQWKFNPPTAPWWGGWWERIVQMVKKLLRRVLGKASLVYEEMLTILCDVEAVINARPLTYVSDDPKDLVPLSPSLFIQDIRTVGVPDLDHLDKVNISKRLRYQQRLREEFRRRFRDEYLSLLVQSPVKQKHLIREIKEGDIVLIKCDSKKRLDWPLGRVVTVFPGRDNCIRVVKVKTAKGDLTRPVQNLYPLEISCSDELCKKADFTKTETDAARVDVIKPTHKVHKTVCDFKNTPEKNISTRIKTKCGRTVKLPKRYED